MSRLLLNDFLVSLYLTLPHQSDIQIIWATKKENNKQEIILADSFFEQGAYACTLYTTKGSALYIYIDKKSKPLYIPCARILWLYWWLSWGRIEGILIDILLFYAILTI